MATIKTVLVKGRCNGSGDFPLVIQVLHKRRKKVVYTGYSICPAQFDSHSGSVLPGKGKYDVAVVRSINRKCMNICKALAHAVALLEKRDGDYDLEDIFRLYETRSGKVGLYAYFREMIDSLSRNGHKGTARAYFSTLRSLQRHLGEADFPFCKFSPKMVSKYHNGLIQSGMCKNTAVFYMHNVKAVYKKGCREFGLDFSFPFSNLKLRTEKTVKRSLSMKDIRAVSRLELQDGTPESLARDLFMFSIYTRGMAFVDIAFLKKGDVCYGEIHYRRCKTGQYMRIGINRQIMDIWEKYREVPGKYLFPLIRPEADVYASYRKSYHKMRYALKKVSRLAGTEVPLRFHAARHSWAMMALESGAPVNTISECLGHSSEGVTRIYLRELDRSVLDKVNDLVAEQIG